MKVNFILSDTTKKATTIALQELTKKAESNKLQNFVVIVPETKSIIIEEEVLKLSKNKAVINVFIYSFVRLLTRLAGARHEGVLSKQAAVIALRKIIIDNYDKLICYRRAAKSIGFAEKIYDTIAQLKSSGIEISDLKEATGKVSESLSLKLADILMLYEKYEEFLSSGMMDECDRLASLKTFASSSDFLKNSEVFIVGFDNITEEMERVLFEIAVTAKSTWFSCCYFAENRADAHIQRNELFTKYKRIADRLKQPYVPNFHKTYTSGDFYEIANYLFSPRKKQVKSNGSVKVFEAKNKLAEIEFVANMILKEVAEGKRYKDIGIFDCGLEENYELIEKVMARFDVPYFINRSHDISNHFLIKFITLAFEIIQNNLSKDSVLEFLSNPLFGDDNIFEIINFVKENGVNHDDFFELAEENSADFSEKSKETIAKFVKFVSLLKKQVSEAKTARDFTKIVLSICEFFDVQKRLEKIGKNLEKNSLILESAIASSIYDKLILVLDMIGSLMDCSSLKQTEFVEILRSAFGSVKMNLSPVSIDCVIISGSTDGFFDIKDLFIIDAVEGKFPIRIDDKGIILDKEIKETQGFTQKLIEPSVRQINARENFRAYEALLEPKEKLFVSYSTSAAGEATVNPSKIVTRLIDLFGDEILYKKYKKFENVSAKALEQELAFMINSFCSGDPDAPLLSQISKCFSLAKPYLSSRMLEHLDSLEEKKCITSEFASQLFSDLKSTSVTRLEEYFKCPYMHFVDFGLKLKENKSAEMNSMDVGTIVHRVVEVFSKNISSFKGKSDEEFSSAVEEVLAAALERHKIKVSKNKSLVKFLKKECVRVCKNILLEQDGSDFKIKYNEFEFGKESDFAFDVGDKKIPVKGKIDRIDVAGENLRVIDYKTGEISSSLKSIYYGEKIQLVSYLLAVEKLGKSVAALLFYPIHSDYLEGEASAESAYRMKGFLLDDVDVLQRMDARVTPENPLSNFISLRLSLGKEYEKTGKVGINHKFGNFLNHNEFEWLKNYTKKLCEQALSEIESGYIEPSPLTFTKTDNDGRCEYCKYSKYCGLENSRFSSGRLCDADVKEGSFFQEEAEDGRD